MTMGVGFLSRTWNGTPQPRHRPRRMHSLLRGRCPYFIREALPIESAPNMLFMWAHPESLLTSHILIGNLNSYSRLLPSLDFLHFTEHWAEIILLFPPTPAPSSPYALPSARTMPIIIRNFIYEALPPVVGRDSNGCVAQWVWCSLCLFSGPKASNHLLYFLPLSSSLRGVGLRSHKLRTYISIMMGPRRQWVWAFYHPR